MCARHLAIELPHGHMGRLDLPLLEARSDSKLSKLLTSAASRAGPWLQKGGSDGLCCRERREARAINSVMVRIGSLSE